MIDTKYIFLDVEVENKDEVLQFIVEMANTFNITNDMQKLLQDLKKRELEFSTGLQDGFAIPHARSEYVNEISVFYLRTKKSIVWETLDNQDVNYIFVLLVPNDNKNNIHLSMISKLATCLLDDNFKERVKKSSNVAELKKYIITKMEEEEE